MALTHTMHTAMNYIRNHLVRFLLLAVILTAGLTLRMAAFAKYSAFLNDYTSAVSGDFFFTSDYLFAKEDRTNGVADYRINSWKGEAYEITVELHNYENSLRFNHTGTDFFYWLEAAVYEDPDCTIPDTRFTSSINYDTVGATDINEKQYGFMPGLAEFDHSAGKQGVRVRVTPNHTIQSGSCYMKVVAHTVPLTEVSSLTPSAGISTNTSRGVYSATLEAVFFLNITSSTANITSDLHPGSASDYTVRYRVICNSSDSTGGSVRVKAYYNSDRLIPDISLGNSYVEREPDNDYFYSAEHPWRYVQATINVGGSEDLYFYKTSLSLTPPIGDNDFGAVVLNTEDIDTTPYSITADPSISGGAVGSIQLLSGTNVTQAAMGTKIYVTLSPDEGYMLSNFSVRDTDLLPLAVTAVSENRYSFEMTNGAVTLIPTFVPRVIINETEHGTVTASPAGAVQGETIRLTVRADEGYELSSILVNGNSSAVTMLTDELFSFVMPNGSAAVTVEFTEIEE